MQHYKRSALNQRTEDQYNDQDGPEEVGAIKHILRTGLPPGITPEEAADPGRSAKEKDHESGVADDRS